MPKFRPLVPMPEFGSGMVCADDVRDQLLAWRASVAARGGRLTVNSMTRTVAQQQVLRDRYVDYLAALAAWERGGRVGPAPAKVAAANRPGRSNHQGGRAVDVSTVAPFPNDPPYRQVDLLWETGAPHGFTPIIPSPDETRSERWHFDFWNDWVGVRDQRGYEEACLCSALDVGQAGEWQDDVRLQQALLLRAGFDVGDVDGIAGKRTSSAMALALGPGWAARYPGAATSAAALRALPARRSWTIVRGT